MTENPPKIDAAPGSGGALGSSHLWVLRAVGRAALAPFRQLRAAVAAAAPVVWIPLVVIFLASFLLSAPGGVAFWIRFTEPQGASVDYSDFELAILELLMWLVASPLPVTILAGICLLAFGPMAFTRWWRRDRSADTEAIGASAADTRALWRSFRLVLAPPFLVCLIYWLLREPVASDAALACRLFAVLVLPIVALRTAHLFARAMDGTERQPIPWRRSFGLAAVFLGLVIVAHFVCFIAGWKMLGFGLELDREGSLAERLSTFWVLVRWNQKFALIAWAYAALALVALMRAETEGVDGG